jgi:heme/copper-type cytochrome/quinol oxidase subunit 3
MRNASVQMTRLFILTSSLIFVSLIVVWFLQDLPPVVIPSIYGTATWFMLASSMLIAGGQYQIRCDEIEKALWFTVMGLVFGLVFSAMQLLGWKELLATNTSFRNILFPFSLIHFIHVAIGLILLLTVLRKIREYKVHSKARAYAYNVFLFWHFLGLVWVAFILLA